ncbi:MAG: branched-chain amino acid ABC transporter permease [Iphinoe sp. HA4291-MV1]|jgi:neutral amino acid transport system permease protein|nr:branched-chain amino acid ABC transporter permease [Iphinoe sp. HA4291-MV1]
MAQYLIFLTISTSILALFGLGLNLQWGFTGLINFGHVAFMTLGAYTTVLLTLKGIPLLLSALIGAVVAAFLGLAIGFSTLRLREDYLAIVTIGVGELIRLVVNNQDLPVGNEWRPGAFGVQSYPIPLATLVPNIFIKVLLIGLLTLLAGVTLWQLWRWIRTSRVSNISNSHKRVGNKQEFLSQLVIGVFLALLTVVIYISGVITLYDYNAAAGLMLLLLTVLAFVFWRLEILVRSPWGRVLKAIREDEEIPKALGKNVFWYKLQSLMLGGAIAGVAGAFIAWQLNAIYPNNFEPIETFTAWIIVILGGSGNNLGTILGAVLYFMYYEGTRNLDKIIPLDSDRLSALRIMIIGLILMVLMIWRPQGILGKKEELTLGK